MILTSEQDIFGNRESFTSGKIRRILDLIDEYVPEYVIREIRQDDINDAHGRIDIEIEYKSKNDRLVRQKLLILNDELIDASTFHRRYKEWYE